jgi:drug/metabolite transporter (DMT)-like permease
MITVTLVLWLVFFIFDTTPSYHDWEALLTLAILTTAIGHTLFVMSFKNFTVSTASIISSIQPIYGIIFLNEIPASKTVIGGFFILLTVIIESFQTKK